LPRISNYTDFEPFLRESDVSVQYVGGPAKAGSLDVICLPGTKSTIADLAWLRARGWDKLIADHHAAGGTVVGICGGYQMMGRQIADPNHIESLFDEAAGLQLLDIATVFEGEKITTRVEGAHLASGLAISGYEIHCGRIVRLGTNSPFSIQRLQGHSLDELEGALHDDGQTFGT